MKVDKAAIKSEFQRHDRDTGSSEVQIAILTKEIEALTEHLKANKKDHSSRYGLLRKVQNRRNLLDYLKRENEQSYKDLIKKLKASAENSKIVVRNARRDGVDLLKKAQKNEGLSEDIEKDAEAEVQKVTDKNIKVIDELVAAKEKEIMTV